MTDEWAGLLEPGEVILWQGAPDGRIRWSDLASLQTAFGVFFTLFSVVWIGFALSFGDAFGLIFVVFGLPFLLLGLYMAGARIPIEARMRRQTHYTLTNRAAYIGTVRFGRRALERHALNGDMPLAIEDGDTGTVYFAEKTVPHATVEPVSDTVTSPGRVTTSTVRVGFEHIQNPRRVYGLLRDAMLAQGARP